MNLSPDDPKLTAYALGELPANEAQEVERELQKSPELRAAVEEIRQMADLLKDEFAVEPSARLSSEEKDAVIANLPPENVVHLSNRNFWRTAGFSAIAASLLCVLAWQFWSSDQPDESFNVARVEQEKVSKPVTQTAAVDAHGRLEEKTVKRELAAVPQGAAPASPVAPKPQGQVPAAAARSAGDTIVLYDAPKEYQLGAVAGGEVAVITGRSATTPQQESYRRTEPAGSTANRTLRFDDRAQETRLAKTRNGTDVPYYSESIATPPPVQPLPLAGRRGTANHAWDLSEPGAAPLVPQPPAAQTTQPLYEWKGKEVAQERPSRPGLERFRVTSELRSFDGGANTARYPKYVENSFESVLQNPLSTFSIDVDTASYANVRRFLNQGVLPPPDAVRIEEMVNYFSYDYPQPKGAEPFSVNMEVASCPWQPEHRLLRIGLKGKEMAQEKRPPSNFVFLIDVSGSMLPAERLPLIKQSLQMLVKRMTENDRVAIVVYAGSSGVVLDSTSAVNKEKILEALDRLEAGGSTNGGQGIQRAYALAEENFIKGGVNRVILCTDGDFNVGITNQDELINLIQRKAKSGVFLSVLGVGTDNYKDALMQKLANKGNGNYYYLDTLEEAHKVLVQQMNGTLVTIAKDVKIQIEFNPAQVSSYRLIGYEKRILAAEDFNNDKKDAGEIGAGHTVTALYEIVPAGKEGARLHASVDELKYQRAKPARAAATREIVGDSKEMLTLKLRYKKPDGDTSTLREHTLVDTEKKFSQASTDLRFAAAVASFGMVLKDSEHKGSANFGSVLELAREAKGDDKEGYRAEFINLVKKARELNRGE